MNTSKRQLQILLMFILLFFIVQPVSFIYARNDTTALNTNTTNTTDNEEDEVTSPIQRLKNRTQSETNSENGQGNNLIAPNPNANSEDNYGSIVRIRTRAERAQRRTQLAAIRLRAMIQRYEKIALRIETRLEAMKEDGINTTEFEASLAEINQAIDDLDTSIDEVEELGESFIGNERPEEIANQIITKIKSTIIEIKSVHTQFKSLIKEMKDAVAQANPDQEEEEEEEDEEENEEENENETTNETQNEANEANETQND